MKRNKSLKIGEFDKLFAKCYQMMYHPYHPIPSHHHTHSLSTNAQNNVNELLLCVILYILFIFLAAFYVFADFDDWDEWLLLRFAITATPITATACACLPVVATLSATTTTTTAAATTAAYDGLLVFKRRNKCYYNATTLNMNFDCMYYNWRISTRPQKAPVHTRNVF